MLTEVYRYHTCPCHATLRVETAGQVGEGYAVGTDCSLARLSVGVLAKGAGRIWIASEPLDRCVLILSLPLTTGAGGDT
eukprot:COSAG01_NODE_19377_length_1013_cov_1.191466_2_plen_79_part_00